MVGQGTTLSLHAWIHYSCEDGGGFASQYRAVITWASTDSAIAKVLPYGDIPKLVFAQAPGEVTIRGSIADLSDTVTVSVVPFERIGPFSDLDAACGYAEAISSVYCWDSQRHVCVDTTTDGVQCGSIDRTTGR